MSLMSSFKGILGETVINIATWLKLDKATYHRLNNITLPLSNGGSTQIDHVIVSVYGIFVIETKNYKGWIYGNEKQKQWTQVFPNGSKYKFQNPLRQNYLHIKTLADLLALDISYFHSMIAFIGECELKTRDELPEQVLKGGVISYIKSKQDELFTQLEVQSIVEQIENNRFSKSWRTNREHKAYLKDKHSSAVKVNTSSTESLNVKQDSKASKPTETTALKASIKVKAKAKEYTQWSGQVEQDDLSTMPFTSENAVFLTPFDIAEPELDADQTQSNKVKTDESALTDERVDSVTLDTIPTCPKCDSVMTMRMAKKGARQGQTFYGCSQFPKCRGVVNIR